MKKTISMMMAILALAVFANSQDLGTIDPEVRNQLNKSLTGYYGLKDAFVDSDVDKASEKADELVKALAAVDVSKMTEAQKATWEKLEKPLSLDARHIRDNKDLPHQRQHFAKLSNNMYALIFNFKANEDEAYLHYCPMKKASWLSDSKEVRNPYYGKKMLDCGAVKATLKKNK